MRVNVYTEELITADDNQPMAQVVTAEYVSSRTGLPMTNYGLRIFVKSHPDLHFIPGRDDDRSAVTFWCGSKEKNVFKLLDIIREQATQSTLDIWRDKTLKQQAAAEAKLRQGTVNEEERRVPRHDAPISGGVPRHDAPISACGGGVPQHDAPRSASAFGAHSFHDTVVASAVQRADSTRRNLSHTPDRPHLDELLRRGREMVDNMTPEQRHEMLKHQCRSWVIGEMMLAHPERSRADIEKVYDEVSNDKP